MTGEIAKKAAKRYRRFLESGDTYEASNLLRRLAIELSDEQDASPGNAMPLQPSKAYKTVRALLQDPTTLDLIFTRALAIPRAVNGPEMVFLVSNLVSLSVVLGYKEFLELFLRNGFLEKLRPLLLHTADWLGTDRFLKEGGEERRLVRTLWQMVLKAATADDMEKGVAFVIGSGLLTKIRANVPWKRQPTLSPEIVVDVSEILATASAFVSMSVFASRERAHLTASFASDDVMGWLQSVLLWAAAAAKKSARARAPLDKFVSDTFVQLARSLQAFALEAPQLAIDLQKLAPAVVLAEKLTSRDVSGAKAFLESLAYARALQGGAQESAGGFSARFQTAAQGGGQSGVQELTPGQRFVDTRYPRDVIGVNGDLMGVREGDEQFSGQIDWGHVIKILQSRDEKAINRLLPTLAAFCVASVAGDIDYTKVQQPPKAWAESLVALLESGRCEELWQKAGVLGSFFSILHGAMCREEYLATGSFSKQDEDWFVQLGGRLMAWLYARVDRLCLQALLMSCTLMADVINLTWTTKLLAVQKEHCLEFVFSVFRLLNRFAASACFGANTLLWQEATSYVTLFIRAPVTQLGNPLDITQKWNNLENTCLEKGILEWALDQCEADYRNNPKHKVLMSRIFLMASQNADGHVKFDTCPKALAILVAEAQHTLEHVLIMKRAGLYPQNAPPGESAARIADVASCLERLARLLMTFYALALETSGARARARWCAFRAAEGLPFLHKVLGEKETLMNLASEHLNPQLREALGDAFGCAEKLWEEAAGEAGLKKCSNPLCSSVELVKGEYKRCGKCKGERYCGHTCQAAHWRQGHKQACRQVSKA